jgi:predicted MFS family arabinose efflux permease
VTAFESLRYRDYRLLWIGAVLSNVGTWMQTTALAWYVLELTGSPFWVGAVGFAQFVPMWLSPFGGVLADRFDRRTILLVTQTWMMLSAVALGLLASTGGGSIGPVMLITLATGLAFAADAPARHAYFPQLVPRRSMVNAIALNSAQFSAARTVGPAVAGPVVALVGPEPVFWINAVSYVAVLLALLAIRTRREPAPPGGRPPVRLGEGLAYVWRHRTLRLLIVSLGVVSLFAAPVHILLPVFARSVYGMGPLAYGLLAAFHGLGAVIGGLVLGRIGRVRPRAIAWAILLCGGALAAVGLIPFFIAGLVLVLAVGGTYLFAISATNSTIQIESDEAFRGRVLGVFLTAFGGLFPIGSLVAGAVASQIGAPATTIMGAAVCALWGLGLLWRARRRPLAEAEPQVTPA